jgi:hypothetical protein
MAWNPLLSMLFPLALLFSGNPAMSAGTSSGIRERRAKSEVIVLKGSIEVDRLEALRTLERKLEGFIRERYGEVWAREAGIMVPRDLVKKGLREGISRHWKRLPILGKRSLQVFETTAGKAFQGEYQVLVGGDEERFFLGWTKAAASRIGRQTRIRLLFAVLLSLLLLFLTGRLDRVTRGYLTKRLYFLSFLLLGGLFWGYAFQGMGALV